MQWTMLIHWRVCSLSTNGEQCQSKDQGSAQGEQAVLVPRGGRAGRDTDGGVGTAWRGCDRWNGVLECLRIDDRIHVHEEVSRDVSTSPFPAVLWGYVLVVWETIGARDTIAHRYSKYLIRILLSCYCTFPYGIFSGDWVIGEVRSQPFKKPKWFRETIDNVTALVLETCRPMRGCINTAWVHCAIMHEAIIRAFTSMHLPLSSGSGLQSWLLQASCWLSQLDWPHCLVLNLVPPPQDLVQGLHSPHSPVLGETVCVCACIIYNI